MGIKSGASKLGKIIFDYRSWMDLPRIQTSYQNLKRTLREIFIVRKDKGESVPLEEAMQEFDLSEEVINERKRNFRNLSMIMLVVTLAVLSYAVYLLLEGHFRGGIVALSVTMVAASMTFRYHFWYFQLKQRKLGCTIGEWLKIGILGRTS